MATHHPPNFIFSGGRQFWCEIHRQSRRRPPHFCIEKKYDISEDRKGGLYCGITLKWHYNSEIQNRYVDISIPGCITKKLQKYKHEILKRPQHAPYPSAPKKYGAAALKSIKPDDSKPAGPEGINRLQKIVRRIFYYAISVDSTILMELATLAIEQSKVTAQTINNLHQLLKFLGTHPDAKIQYYASNMILKVHSDAS